MTRNNAVNRGPAPSSGPEPCSAPAGRDTPVVPGAPVACTLTPAGLAAQAGRWQRLGARAMSGRTETPSGLRLRFRRAPGVEDELRALVAVENECCAWADWTVHPGPGHVVLDIRSSGDGVAALHAMFTGC